MASFIPLSVSVATRVDAGITDLRKKLAMNHAVLLMLILSTCVLMGCPANSSSSTTPAGSPVLLHVAIDYPGAMPQQIEMTIAEVIEPDVRTVKGVQKVTGICQPNRYNGYVDAVTTDIKSLQTAIEARIKPANLPADISHIHVMPVASIPQPAASSVDLVRIQPDRQRMAEFGLTMQDIVLAMGHAQGTMRKGWIDFTIENLKKTNRSDLSEARVKLPSGDVVPLSSLAEITRTREVVTPIVRVNGRRITPR